MFSQSKSVIELVFALGSLLALVASVAFNISTWQAKMAMSQMQLDSSKNQQEIIVAQQELAQKQQEMAKTQQSFLRHYQEFTRKTVQNINHNLVQGGVNQQEIEDIQAFLAKNNNFTIKKGFPKDSIPNHTDFIP